MKLLKAAILTALPVLLLSLLATLWQLEVFAPAGSYQPLPAPLTVDIQQIERQRILRKAQRYITEPPRTVTADRAERSAGGPHDFYSQGDYWWPDPENPDGPYKVRDGQSNPDNFLAHRQSMRRLSEIVATLTSAWIITGEQSYAAKAYEHLAAWFVTPATRMNPSLLYSQAIIGRSNGRSIGIIDTIHLVEVARSAKLLAESDVANADLDEGIKTWFSQYLHWLNTHRFGIAERDHPNNHGITWSLQVAAFADLVNSETDLRFVRNRFKTLYLTEHMASDGSFPAELDRTKPYGYSLFVMDAMAGIAQLASVTGDNLWAWQRDDGRSLRLGMAYIYPYIVDKNSWPYQTDVMAWEAWPVRHPALLLAAVHYNNPSYLQTWLKLEPDPSESEVLRNLPMRHPLLWLNNVRFQAENTSSH